MPNCSAFRIESWCPIAAWSRADWNIGAGARANRASSHSRMPSGSFAAGCKVPELRVAALLLACVLITPGARADRQQDPELKAVLQKAIIAGQCFTEKYDAEVWYKLMEPRLRKYVKDLGERIEILTNVYCEARHCSCPPNWSWR